LAANYDILQLATASRLNLKAPTLQNLRVRTSEGKIPLEYASAAGESSLWALENGRKKRKAIEAEEEEEEKEEEEEEEKTKQTKVSPTKKSASPTKASPTKKTGKASPNKAAKKAKVETDEDEPEEAGPAVTLEKTVEAMVEAAIAKRGGGPSLSLVTKPATATAPEQSQELQRVETTSSSAMLDIKAILKEHAEANQQALTQLFTATADALKSNQDVLRSNQEVLAKVLTDSAEERRTMWSQLADDRRV